MLNLKQQFVEFENRYNARYLGTDDEIHEHQLKKWLKSHRFLDKKNFVKLGLWKSRRVGKHYGNNPEDLIREITRFSLSTKSEEARVLSLICLSGVSFPVASVILHFAFPDKYPILDFRAIWSLGLKQPKRYDFAFWKMYCRKIRSLSKKYKMPIRSIDKALWEYSKEKQ